MQKNMSFCFIAASSLLYCFSTLSMEFPSHQASNQGNGYSQVPLFPSIPNEHKKPILGFEIKDLAQLAPIAIVMYCFNEFPRFTMAGLSFMLIYTISAKEVFKIKRLKAIQKVERFCRKKILLLYGLLVRIAQAHLTPRLGSNVSHRSPL